MKRHENVDVFRASPWMIICTALTEVKFTTTPVIVFRWVILCEEVLKLKEIEV